MGKRSDFKRRKNDLYDTPAKAVIPLLSHLVGVEKFLEPCYGRGYLANALEEWGYKMTLGIELQEVSKLGLQEPDDRVMFGNDSTDWDTRTLHLSFADAIITNPPWTREILHPMILHFQKALPTWLLFDSDWAFTKQAIPYLDQCSDIVSIGRLKWIPDSPHAGKDNCAWYRFHNQHSGGPKFHNLELEAA